MRRLGLFSLLLAALALTLASCAPLVEEAPQEAEVCATFYPFYALTSLLTEGVDGLRLSCLVQPQDGCLRAYELSEWDLYQLAAADLVVAGGRGLESFEGTLQSLGDAGPAVALTLYNTELYDQGDSSEDGAEDSHWNGVNPHDYMSIEGAKYILEGVAIALSELFPQHAEAVRASLEAATARVDGLGAQMRSLAADAAGGRVILMSEALVYTAQELGLEVAGRYERESGQMLYEGDVEDCLERLAAMDACVVLVEKQAPASLVEALEGAGYIVARLDVLSTLRADQGAEGYFAAQEENARAVAAAFAQVEGTH